MNGKGHHVEMIREGQMNIFEAAHQQERLEAKNMLQKAIDKIRKEMQANGNNPYVQVIGEFLINFLEVNPGESEKITADKKTIVNSVIAMSELAMKSKPDNRFDVPEKRGYGVLFTSEQGFKVVLDYFGIKANSDASLAMLGTNITENNAQKAVISALQIEAAPVPKKKFEVVWDEF